MSCKKLFFDLPVAFVTYFILCKKIFWIINTIPFRTMCHPSVCKEYRHCVVKWEHCSSNILLSKMANYPNTSLERLIIIQSHLTQRKVAVVEMWPLRGNRGVIWNLLLFVKDSYCGTRHISFQSRLLSFLSRQVSRETRCQMRHVSHDGCNLLLSATEKNLTQSKYLNKTETK